MTQQKTAAALEEVLKKQDKKLSALLRLQDRNSRMGRQKHHQAGHSQESPGRPFTTSP